MHLVRTARINFPGRAPSSEGEQPVSERYHQSPGNVTPPSFFPPDAYILSVYMDGVQQPLAPTELALTVKNSSQPGAYCLVFHPIDQPVERPPPGRCCPTDLPPAPPARSASTGDSAAEDTVEPEGEEEESLISL